MIENKKPPNPPSCLFTYLNWSEIEGNKARRNILKLANDQRVAIMLFAIGLVRQINFPVLP
jgi:hypothetical protein